MLGDSRTGLDGQAEPDGLASGVSGVEATVVGWSRDEVAARVSRALESLLGEPVREVLFRAGRIDAPTPW